MDLTGSITGTVKDYDDGGLISNCQITMSPGGLSKNTGTDGQFEFEDVSPGIYSLTFKKSGYEDETKSVSVIAGKISSLPVTLKALKANMAVSESKLEFGASVTTKSFTVSNTGKGNLEWNVVKNADWLTCTPVEGTVSPSQSATLVVTVDRQGLERGNYEDNLVVASNVGGTVVLVSMSVALVELSVTPAALDFGDSESSLSVSMKNPSGRTLKYTVSASNDWITVSKSKGSITTEDSFKVVVSRSGLNAGDYDGNVIIGIDGEEVSIPVKMTVAEKIKPTVSIEEIYDITTTGVKVKATVKSVGSAKITRYGVCWSKSPEPTIEDRFSNFGDCVEPKSFESTILELDSETRYYVRAYAENAAGLTYSEHSLSFTTSAKPAIPSVSTIAIDDLTTTSVTATGRISSLGNVAKVTGYGHVWGTSPQPTLSSCAHSSLGETASVKEFSSDVTSLSAGTKYYIRAYATNSEGTAYGEDISFTTKDYESPSVTTGQPSNVKKNSFSVTGEISSTGGLPLSDYGHCWSTSPNPTVSDSKTSFGSRSSSGSYSSEVSGLAAGTTYYVRAYAVNSKGTGYSGQIAVSTPESTTDRWDGNIASSFAGGSGTSVDPYIIETGGQLVLMKNYSNKCFQLANNIDLNNNSWPSFDFSGTFDGNRYTISNLKVSKTGNNLGFFADCKGTVKNLIINGVNIKSGTSYNVGAIAGSCSNGTIKNCSVILNGDSKILGNNNVGGVVGFIDETGTVSECSVSAPSAGNVILGSQLVGGIAGGRHPNYSSDKTFIEKCHVNAMIYGEAYVGGILGGVSYTGKTYITSCSFKGFVSGDSCVGGIFGGEQGYGSATAVIKGCKSDATIEAADCAGGIYGYSSNEEMEVYGCYAAGVLKCSNSTAKWLGGIGGHSDSYMDDQIELSYSTVTSDHSNFGGLGGYYDGTDILRAKDCAAVMTNLPADKNGKLTNCSTECTDITDFLRSCYSEYAEYYNFNNTWTWTGVINGKTVSVSCPKLAWE